MGFGAGRPQPEGMLLQFLCVLLQHTPDKYWDNFCPYLMSSLIKM